MLQLEIGARMSHWKRLVYAFFFSVFVLGLLTLVEMILSVSPLELRIGDFVFSAYFFVPLLVIVYLITPYIARRIKLD